MSQQVGLGLIWAEARGGAIGREGTMPWHLPEDLAHFKAVTLGAPVIMGRRTWQSLPERFRPLPGRENFVVSRDEAFDAHGATTVGSLDAAVARARARAARSGGDAAESRVWVIGGGELYRQAMPLAEQLIVTRIELDVPDADTRAPEIGNEWLLADAGRPLESKTGLGYRFERWVRR